MATLLQATPNERSLRIEKRWQDTNWSTVWRNLWATPVPDSTKDSWYRVIHDIVPTREGLHAIRPAQTDLCQTCHVQDRLSHRITVCGDGREQWSWTRQRLAVMLRTDTRWINEDWLCRPQFRLWPAQQQSCAMAAGATNRIPFAKRKGRDDPGLF
jgi:hypothetical protein